MRLYSTYLGDIVSDSLLNIKQSILLRLPQTIKRLIGSQRNRKASIQQVRVQHEQRRLRPLSLYRYQSGVDMVSTNKVRQLRNRRRIEDSCNRQRRFKRFIDTRKQTHDRKRVSTEGEEVVLNPNCASVQHLLPYINQLLLDLVTRTDIGNRLSHLLRGDNPRIVDRPIDSPRQRTRNQNAVRPQIRRNTFRKILLQRERGCRLVGTQCNRQTKLRSPTIRRCREIRRRHRHSTMGSNGSFQIAERNTH